MDIERRICLNGHLDYLQSVDVSSLVPQSGDEILLVDGIIRYNLARSEITTGYTVRSNNILRGHFSILPGVLYGECVNQALIALARLKYRSLKSLEDLPFLRGIHIDDLKEQAKAGDVLITKAVLKEEKKEAIFVFSGEVFKCMPDGEMKSAATVSWAKGVSMKNLMRRNRKK